MNFDEVKLIDQSATLEWLSQFGRVCTQLEPGSRKMRNWTSPLLSQPDGSKPLLDLRFDNHELSTARTLATAQTLEKIAGLVGRLHSFDRVNVQFDQQKLSRLKELKIAAKELPGYIKDLSGCLKVRFLDVSYESGVVEREGYLTQVDLNGVKEGRTLFEIALNAVGKPTTRDEMIAMVYHGVERAKSAINGVKSTLNAKLEHLNLEVDKEFCLRNFRPEK